MGLNALNTPTNSLAADARTLDALKFQANQNSPVAIKETAKQFESLFMRELLKSMREANASMKSGLLDSPQGDLGTDLLDQQFAVQMSGQPGGLSDLIAAQLSRQMGAPDAIKIDKKVELPSPIATPKSTPVSAATAARVSQTGFVQRHTEVAERVAHASGIPASFMIGQAGHETGWGKFEIKNKDGSSSNNLFGIKAGPSWTGKVATVTTTEFVDGVAKKTVAKFRAYDSYEDSFKDYARLISESPRYAKARQQTDSVQAFATGLQRAGYATDPDYAAKLSRAINATLQVQRAQA
jgi:peptidoglycan hydrolase FlgJ